MIRLKITNASADTSTPQILHLCLREHHRAQPRNIIMSQNNRKSAVRLSLLEMASIPVNMLMWKVVKFHRVLPLSKEL